MSLPVLWWAVLAVGAAARLTRAVTADRITAAFRAWWLARYGATSLAGEFITCPWCIGLYFSLVVVGTGWWAAVTGHPWWWIIPCAALTVSYVVGLLGAIDR